MVKKTKKAAPKKKKKYSAKYLAREAKKKAAEREAQILLSDPDFDVVEFIRMADIFKRHPTILNSVVDSPVGLETLLRKGFYKVVSSYSKYISINTIKNLNMTVLWRKVSNTEYRVRIPIPEHDYCITFFIRHWTYPTPDWRIANGLRTRKMSDEKEFVTKLTRSLTKQWSIRSATWRNFRYSKDRGFYKSFDKADVFEPSKHIIKGAK